MAQNKILMVLNINGTSFTTKQGTLSQTRNATNRMVTYSPHRFPIATPRQVADGTITFEFPEDYDKNYELELALLEHYYAQDASKITTDVVYNNMHINIRNCQYCDMKRKTDRPKRQEGLGTTVILKYYEKDVIIEEPATNFMIKYNIDNIDAFQY